MNMTVPVEVGELNKIIDGHCPGYFLLPQNGYVLIEGPDTRNWLQRAVPVRNVADLNPGQWLAKVKEAIANKTTRKN